MSRALKIITVVAALGYLLDAEWRQRMLRARQDGLERKIGSGLAEHRAQPHVMHLFGRSDWPDDGPISLGLSGLGSFNGLETFVYDSFGRRVSDLQHILISDA